MSSRLIPPKVGSSNWQGADDFLRIFGGELYVELRRIGEAFEQYALAFMTGLPAAAPILPSPSTAVPLVTTGDEVALGGVLIGEAGSFSIARHGTSGRCTRIPFDIARG